MKRWWVVVVFLAVLGTACSSEPSTEIFDESAPDDRTPDATADGATAADAVDRFDVSGSELSEAELAEATGFYQRFLALSDQALVGDVEATEGLNGIASADVLVQFDQWQVDNDELRADDLGIEGLTSAANIVAVSGGPAALIIEDCVEVQEERQLLGLDTYRFVEQAVTMHAVEGGWYVDDVEVRNDGGIESGGLGCAPTGHQERVEQSTAEMLDALSALFASPSSDLSPEVNALVDEPALTSLRGEVDVLAQSGWVLASPEEHEIEVLGSEAAAGNRTFVVATCTYFPEGRPVRSVDTGDVVTDFESPIKPQSYFYQEFYVRTTDAPDGGLVDKVIEIKDQQFDSLCGGA